MKTYYIYHITGVKIGCTPAAGYTPGDVINFMDFRVSGTSLLTGTSFKLQWDGTPTCVQINELFIEYTGTDHFHQRFSEMGLNNDVSH